jgi:Ca2+-binding EF-hand superfamily protein
MAMTRKDQIAKDKEALMKKDFVVKNPIFTFDHIS